MSFSPNNLVGAENPVRAGQAEVEIDATQLAMLLDGIDIKRVQAPRRWTPPSRTRQDTSSSP